MSVDISIIYLLILRQLMPYKNLLWKLLYLYQHADFCTALFLSTFFLHSSFGIHYLLLLILSHDPLLIFLTFFLTCFNGIFMPLKAMSNSLILVGMNGHTNILLYWLIRISILGVPLPVFEKVFLRYLLLASYLPHNVHISHFTIVPSPPFRKFILFLLACTLFVFELSCLK